MWYLLQLSTLHIEVTYEVALNKRNPVQVHVCRCLEPAEEVFHGAAAGMSFSPGADGSAHQERHELAAARQALRGCVEHVLGPAEADWDLHMFVSLSSPEFPLLLLSEARSASGRLGGLAG